MTIISQISKQVLESPQTKRFSSNKGEITRSLNKLAINSTKSDKMVYTYPKASPEDLKRLTSKSIKDSYKRVTWINPKDNKTYHILEEERNNEKVNVRILDKDGEFIKNAELTPKNIVIFDNFYSPKSITHGELMETFVKRFNPFANVERLPHKKNLYEMIKYRGQLPLSLEEKRFDELANKIDNGKKVDYISISETEPVYLNSHRGISGNTIKETLASGHPFIRYIKGAFDRILSKNTRILEAAGNDPQYAEKVLNIQLAIDGVEGVGSLVNGKIAADSCSRNSAFTRHYEKRNYFPKAVKDSSGKIMGINITGLDGTDLPITRKTKKLLKRPCIGGTSYATPVRTAKLALNDMLEGVI